MKKIMAFCAVFFSIASSKALSGQPVQITQEQQEQYALYCACRKFAVNIEDCAATVTRDKRTSSAWNILTQDGEFDSSVRTLQGVVVEFYYGNPFRLLTPWGRWTFCPTSVSDCNMPDKKKMALLCTIAQLSLAKEVQQISGWGDVGPFYNLESVGEIKLPEASDWENKGNDQVLEDQWKAMGRYYRENPPKSCLIR